ncbi:MAG: hypothetical protein HYX42_22530 [Polaromonas sp.]|uniref:hypothetical protein n=1 Tax=Polaromonas sp. TaxID=1869339 RepID=UPI0025EE285E|nr:hypothetical protein [Polaromonas sp.]MBI2729023.1 hypothetical protein [Polaromonas sp.]
MAALRWTVNFLCAAVICFVFFYLVISLFILGAIMFGVLVPDMPMYIDTPTPTIASLLKFQLASLVPLAVCLYVRATFGRKNDLAFLKKA